VTDTGRYVDKSLKDESIPKRREEQREIEWKGKGKEREGREREMKRRMTEGRRK